MVETTDAQIPEYLIIWLSLVWISNGNANTDIIFCFPSFQQISANNLSADCKDRIWKAMHSYPKQSGNHVSTLVWQSCKEEKPTNPLINWETTTTSMQHQKFLTVFKTIHISCCYEHIWNIFTQIDACIS